MEIKYEVFDGYAGKDGLNKFKIDEDEIRGCETFKEAIKYVKGAIQEEFDNTITWHCLNRDEIEARVRKLLAEKKQRAGCFVCGEDADEDGRCENGCDIED